MHVCVPAHGGGVWGAGGEWIRSVFHEKIGLSAVCRYLGV